MKKNLIIVLLIFLFPIFCSATDKIDLNLATLTQLDELTGIGPVIAQRIIDARPFSALDDLDRVNGIGPATLQKIKDQGLAYVGGETQQIITASSTPTPAASLAPTPAPAIIYPSGVFINEIMPNPKGADETDEWIELYNSNDFDVDIYGWQIQDTNGTPKTFTILKGKIATNGFLVLNRPETKIMLNNETDGLSLLKPDKSLADVVNFLNAPLGQSYNKTITAWIWSTTPTPGGKNIIAKAPSANSGPNGLSKDKNSVKNEFKDASLADISRALDGNQDKTAEANPWFLFFTVLVITIILSVVVLIIKLKFKNNVRT